MSDSITITPATPDDFPEVWPFLRGILAEGKTYAYPRDMTEAQAKAMWFAPDKRVFLARDETGRVVGSFYLRPNREGPGSHIANAGFIVCPTARGKGLARRMGCLAMEEARAEGYRGMQFNFVVSTNTTAVKAWQDIGMQIAGTIPGGYRLPDGEFVDAYVMYGSLE